MSSDIIYGPTDQHSMSLKTINALCKKAGFKSISSIESSYNEKNNIFMWRIEGTHRTAKHYEEAMP